MKIVSLIALVITTSALCCSAQELMPVRLGIGLGYAATGPGAAAGSGGLLYIEPAYRPSDNIIVGFKVESAVIARGVDGAADDYKGNGSTIVSYTFNGQYYLSDAYARPFVGIGAGIYSMSPVRFHKGTGRSITENVGAGTSFAFYPRVGIDIGHFNATIDYNVIPSFSVRGGGKVINSYVAIKAGYSIGGGIGKRARNIR
jgi:hypothetical protein